MALHSISEAARLAGKARSTLHRHLEAGRLSRTTAPDGTPAIETAELVRVYGPLHALQAETGAPACPIGQRATPPSDTRDTPHEPARELAAELAGLQRGRIEALERRMAELEAERDAWRDQADAWREQARTALLRLPMPPASPMAPSGGPLEGSFDPPPGSPTQRSSGLLRRLRRAVAGVISPS